MSLKLLFMFCSFFFFSERSMSENGKEFAVCFFLKTRPWHSQTRLTKKLETERWPSVLLLAGGFFSCSFLSPLGKLLHWEIKSTSFWFWLGRQLRCACAFPRGLARCPLPSQLPAGPTTTVPPASTTWGGFYWHSCPTGTLTSFSLSSL